jgi:hypothetical protein
MTVRSTILLAALFATCISIGCSKSSTTQASSESSSKSFSSPFKSSSNSSSGGEEEAGAEEESAFRRDVSDYTTTYAGNPGDAGGFQRGLGRIAESHGITDWESRTDTYHAIGRGLGVSDIDHAHYTSLAIALANDRFDRLDAIRMGYESVRR